MSVPSKPPTFPPTSITRPIGPASGGPASDPYGREAVAQLADIGRDMAADTGVSPPALLGYVTSGLVLLFGAGGMLFSDMPGEVKKQLAAGYAAASVGLVLASSFVDSHHRISMRR